MAHIVVLGAGLGGTLMAYELVPMLGASDTLSVVGQGSQFHFVPSNPWVAVGWRDREEIEVNLDDVMKKKRINFITPSGEGGGAWFATAWFTNGLNIGKQLNFVKLEE